MQEYTVDFSWNQGKTVKIKAASFVDAQRKASALAETILEDNNLSCVDYNVFNEEDETSFSGWITG